LAYQNTQPQPLRLGFFVARKTLAGIDAALCCFFPGGLLTISFADAPPPNPDGMPSGSPFFCRLTMNKELLCTAAGLTDQAVL
jgi:hypothetical protein